MPASSLRLLYIFLWCVMLYILCGVCSGGSHSSQSVDFVLHRYIFYLVWILQCYIFYVVCAAEAHSRANQWISYFTSTENRHALPLFTSLLNVVCAYDPVGYGMPYNHLMFTDTREPLVEVALHVLCATLEGSEPAVAPSDVIAGTANVKPANEVHENELHSLLWLCQFDSCWNITTWVTSRLDLNSWELWWCIQTHTHTAVLYTWWQQRLGQCFEAIVYS